MHSQPTSPMLAKDVDINTIQGKVLVQPKLDGVRAIWNPQSATLHTRNGNPITSCDHIIKAIYDSQLQHMEAILLGFEPTTSKTNKSTFGALLLLLPNGKTFKCAGINFAQRQSLWQQKPIGALITVIFKGLTNAGIPREPRFKTIRHDLGVTA